MQDVHKKPSQTKRIIDALRDGPKTNRQLNRICFRYSARIAELREEGYRIVTDQIKLGYFKYTLTGEPK